MNPQVEWWVAVCEGNNRRGLVSRLSYISVSVREAEKDVCVVDMTRRPSEAPARVDLSATHHTPEVDGEGLIGRIGVGHAQSGCVPPQRAQSRILHARASSWRECCSPVGLDCGGWACAGLGGDELLCWVVCFV